jgi:hypothetical protein
MAILNHTFTAPARRVLFATLCCVVASCGLFGAFASDAKPYVFDHKVHAAEGLECDACHATWESEEAPGMPTIGGCKLCHDDLDAQKPEDRRIGLLFEGETFKAKRLTKLSDEIVFSHLKHATKPIECNACHVGIADNTQIDAGLAVTMTECETCHTQQQVKNDCATCHEKIRVDVAPDSHLTAWQKLHGPMVRSQSAETVNNCKLCHTESSCSECHESTPPENHNNFFRLRGHGLHARMDRQTCSACHRSDSCDACHAETQPMSHTGSFASGASTHCLGCHLPIQNSDCFTCHREQPAHATATPLPPDHNAGMNCRMCHGQGQPMPHVDKGDDCTSCHR